MARRETRPPDPEFDDTRRHGAARADDRGVVEDRDRVVERIVAVGNGTGVAAFVLGMFAATFAFLVVTAPAAVLFGIIAVVLGIAGIGKANAAGGVHKGLSVTGIVSGGLGLLLGVALLVGGFTLFDRVQQDPRIQERIEDLGR